MKLNLEDLKALMSSPQEIENDLRQRGCKRLNSSDDLSITLTGGIPAIFAISNFLEAAGFLREDSPETISFSIDEEMGNLTLEVHIENIRDLLSATLFVDDEEWDEDEDEDEDEEGDEEEDDDFLGRGGFGDEEMETN